MTYETDLAAEPAATAEDGQTGEKPVGPT
jgi:hypothetical protein